MQRTQSAMIAWFVWFLASFFYAYQYILRVLPNIMMSDILQKFHIEAGAFGQYSGLYYLGYAGMHIPLGLLLDKYGPKRILPICMLLTSLGVLPMIYSENWVYPTLGRFLIGIGSSAAILGVFKIIRMTFEAKHFTRMLGFSVTIGLLGAIYGGQPVNYLMGNFGYEIVLKVIAATGILLAIATYMVIPHHQSEPHSQSIMQEVKLVLTNKMVIAICLLAGMMVGPLEGFADVWGKEYLKTSYGLEDSFAATAPSMIFLGMCIGSSLMSLVAERTRAYYEIIITSAIVMGAIFTGLLLGFFPPQALSIVFLIVGVFCAYQILSIYKASTYVPTHLMGLTTAIANMIIMTFGYIFHSLIGKIMDIYWDGQIVDGTAIYQAKAFAMSLSVIPMALLLATIGYSYIYFKEK
tara:strand:+ start:16979 stop:18202 length:1224 start_codon:yes stop_codon:yes gene_type:complete